jgi:hypothetical protein
LKTLLTGTKAKQCQSFTMLKKKNPEQIVKENMVQFQIHLKET